MRAKIKENLREYTYLVIALILGAEKSGELSYSVGFAINAVCRSGRILIRKLRDVLYSIQISKDCSG